MREKFILLKYFDYMKRAFFTYFVSQKIDKISLQKSWIDAQREEDCLYIYGFMLVKHIASPEVGKELSQVCCDTNHR